MLLTIDVGNTNTVFTIFDGEGCVFESRIDTDSSRMADQYAVLFGNILQLYRFDISAITAAIISSVVPTVTLNVAMAVRNLSDKEPLIVGPGVKTGLNIKIDDPGSLGADLVCGAVAAKEMYPLPCIAVDLGTVSKVMAIDKTGALIGGVLAPGVGVGFEVMAKSTALLPLVGTAPPDKIIGTNTADCIRGGVLYGTACMLDGLIERFEAQIGQVCTVVATGGFSQIIAPYCKREMVINERLVSMGLKVIYYKNV
jgi:type III pantothenate kinase